MRRKRSSPSYSLDSAKELARSSRVILASRARKFLREHCVTDGTAKAVRAIFDAMEPKHFVKSEELDHQPGTFADIYCGMVYDDIPWYVKFYIDEDGNENLQIWSANWDGAVH